MRPARVRDGLAIATLLLASTHALAEKGDGVIDPGDDETAELVRRRRRQDLPDRRAADPRPFQLFYKLGRPDVLGRVSLRVQLQFMFPKG